MTHEGIAENPGMQSLKQGRGKLMGRWTEPCCQSSLHEATQWCESLVVLSTQGAKRAGQAREKAGLNLAMWPPDQGEPGAQASTQRILSSAPCFLSAGLLGALHLSYTNPASC